MPRPRPLDFDRRREWGDGILDLVKYFEGFYPAAYRDIVGVWTIGYGHTGLIHRDGTVHRGREITEPTALLLLEMDLDHAAAGVEAALDHAVLARLTQYQYEALVDFTFNLGAGAFRRSTLRRKVAAGDIVGASREFRRWRYAGKIPLLGLYRRRLADRDFFLGRGFRSSAAALVTRLP